MDVSSARWHQTSTITALIQWIPDLTKATMPNILRETLLKSKKPLVASDVNHLSDEDLITLAQWTDLIIFDYLTGNYDRVASMQVNLFIYLLKNRKLPNYILTGCRG